MKRKTRDERRKEKRRGEMCSATHQQIDLSIIRLSISRALAISLEWKMNLLAPLVKRFIGHLSLSRSPSFASSSLSLFFVCSSRSHHFRSFSSFVFLFSQKVPARWSTHTHVTCLSIKKRDDCDSPLLVRVLLAKDRVRQQLKPSLLTRLEGKEYQWMRWFVRRNKKVQAKSLTVKKLFLLFVSSQWGCDRSSWSSSS